MKLLNNWRVIILLCLTLGLAPFLPEPHIIGKLRWLSSGANGMTIMDYFDVLLHGFPFILLLRLLIIKITKTNGA
ncbi:hypothetical protein ACFQ1Q_08580 [Winogradskyella litorisediminis]|uniref:RND transporter n=1 Tax=Winogradskyella litorisediminis TaxID=1156618 RepID=A0ABW3N6N2_9FLAO